MDIYTIGHSTLTKEEFLDMLSIAEIETLVDIRSFPASRKFPQFNQTRFKEWLNEANIEYIYAPLLGGRRNKSQLIQEEVNDGWENQSFHNYADYTLTEDFQDGIKKLKEISENKNVVYCCSERHPARCHRLLISNWLAAEGWHVYHIIKQGKENILELHELGKWGAMPILVEDGTVAYPKLKHNQPKE